MQYRWIFLGFVLVIMSCGSGDPFAYVKVSGKVTFKGGSQIEAHRVTVTFIPQTEPIDERAYPRSGMAEVNVSDGTFDVVTSHTYGDGIVGGRHKVLIRTYDKQDNPIDVVSPAYSNPDTTPLLVNTAETTYFNLTVRKPES